MGNYEQLKQSVSDVIKTNGNQEITGSILQNVLLTIISTVGANAAFAGIATPATNPGTPDGPVFYLASEGGTYPNFNAIELQDGLSVLMWNGSWSSQQIFGIDNEPIAGSDNLVKSGGVFNNIGALDISELNATENPHTLATYEDLTSALNALPISYRKGGMSVKFVQSSDNKYVQYRLMSEEFSTDTDDWAIADEGTYVENPEFIYVKTDAEGKILWAIKTDGGIHYGAGIPQQVIDYVEQKIADLSLDEYKDIVAFLNGLAEGDKTLQMLLNEKVDKEEGKSLINAEYAEGVHYIESPEFAEIKLDAEQRILEATYKDGTKVIGGNLQVLGSLDIKGTIYSVVSNPEWLKVVVDANNRVICGIKVDGKFYVGDADFLDDIKTIKARLENLDIFSTIDNQEFIDVKTDADDRIVEAIRNDGTKVLPAGVETPKVNLEAANIENKANPEYIEVKVDAENKLLEGTKTDGTKVIGGNLEVDNDLKVDGDVEVGGNVSYKNGIPQAIIDYVAANTGSGVTNIEYEDETGDMYATFDDADGVTDVYMDENGNIYTEIEE